jgi:NitT/TauT family transport system substrate-binding protein
MGFTAVRATVLLAIIALVMVACGTDTDDPTTGAGTPGAGTPGTETPGTETPTADATPEPDDFEPAGITLTLNFLAGGPQAGFTYAKELGYYDEVGLDVTIEEGQGSATTAQLVASGATDIGYADGPAIMQLRAQGADITIVAVILQTNGFAVISLEETGIEQVSDLVGRRLAVQPAGAPGLLLPALLEENNVDPADIDQVASDPAALIPALLQGEVDAIVAGADSQSVNIRAEGFEINEQFYRDNGVPTVGLSIAVPDSLIESNPELVSRFVDASLRGWDAARDDPRAAAESLVATFVAADVEQIHDQLLVDLMLVCAEGAETLGMPPAQNWDLTHELLVEFLELPEEPPIDEYYTTEFIPADAPAC